MQRKARRQNDQYLSPLDGAVVAAVPTSKRVFAYGDKMARQNEDAIRIAKLKAHIEIFCKRLVELGEDPSMLVEAGMFCRYMGRVTVKSAMIGYIERKRSSGADFIGIKMIRDAIKYSVHAEDTRQLTKTIRRELLSLAESGVINLDGDTIRFE